MSDIEYRLINPGRPQTNGNGRISNVLATRRYESGEDLKQILKRYITRDLFRVLEQTA